LNDFRVKHRLGSSDDVNARRLLTILSSSIPTALEPPRTTSSPSHKPNDEEETTRWVGVTHLIPITVLL
jgi:hypothetical protein